MTLETPLVFRALQHLAVAIGPCAELGLRGDVAYSNRGIYDRQSTDLDVLALGGFVSLLAHWP